MAIVLAMAFLFSVLANFFAIGGLGNAVEVQDEKLQKVRSNQAWGGDGNGWVIVRDGMGWKNVAEHSMNAANNISSPILYCVECFATPNQGPDPLHINRSKALSAWARL